MLLLLLFWLDLALTSSAGPGWPGLRTNGVDTNGAAAKVITFDRLGKKYTHKVPLSKIVKFAVASLVLTPFVPFRWPLPIRASCSRGRRGRLAELPSP